MDAQFLTPLQVEELEDTSSDGRGTWKVIAVLKFWSALLQLVVCVPVGFITDFASVPRLPIVFLLCGDCGHKAAVLHDWLYTSQTLTRAAADAVLREACVASGVPKWRAWSMWAGVRVGGASHWTAPATPQPANVAAQLEAA